MAKHKRPKLNNIQKIKDRLKSIDISPAFLNDEEKKFANEFIKLEDGKA